MPFVTNINIFDNQVNSRSFEKVPSVAQLERAREVILGRQLENVERRLDEMEKRLGDQSSDALSKRVEEIFFAMQNQMTELRMQLHQEISQRQQEMAQAVVFFQQSTQNAAVDESRVGSEIELRLHEWLAAWQRALEQHLVAREQWMLQMLREESQRAHHASSVQLQQQVQHHLTAAVQTMNAAAHSLSQMAHNLTPTV